MYIIIAVYCKTGPRRCSGDDPPRKPRVIVRVRVSIRVRARVRVKVRVSVRV